MRFVRIISQRNLIPWLIILIFVFLQLSAIDYGTTINNLPHIADSVFTKDQIADAKDDLFGAAAIASIINPKVGQQILWAIRFKLYAVEADEHMNLIALSNIQPSSFKFDPRYYQYGGAFLYPLGLFLITIFASLGRLPLTLDSLIMNGNYADSLYILGRLFVLTAFTISAYYFYKLTLKFTGKRTALYALALYVFAPASVMFSISTKPHWFGLLWVTLTMFFFSNIWLGKLNRYTGIILGILLGLAVGSAITYALFAVLTLGALFIAFKRRMVTVHTLWITPTISIIVFLITNPYLLIGWENVQSDTNVFLNWYHIQYNPIFIWQFLKNSFLPGFSIFGVTAIYLGLRDFLGRRLTIIDLIPVSLFCITIVVAYLTSSVSYWHINYRVAPYLMPLAILFVVIKLKRHEFVLMLLVIFTILHSIPLLIAFHDENNALYSTRLTAAKWIDSNIPTNSSICANMAPSHTAPFNWYRFNIKQDNCAWRIIIDRQADKIVKPSNALLAARFYPRLSSAKFPLVYSNINPQISIYKIK